MECIYAILLYAAGTSQFMSRLAIVSTGKTPPYSKYALYEAPTSQQFPYLHPRFPVVDEKSSIIMTHGHVESPNTHIAVYCSVKLSRLEIEEKVVHRLQPITTQSRHLSKDNTASEKSCLTNITQLSRQRRATPVFSSELIALPDCSEEIIASLAYQNLILVTGQYSMFAPQYVQESRIRVHSDTPFQMRNLISDDQFFAMEKIGPESSALAWYQGHLHVFVRSMQGNLWRPITKVGREERNAFEIINWLEKSGKLQLYIQFRDKYEGMISCLNQNDAELCDDNEDMIQANKLLAELFSRIKILELVPSSVSGEIGQYFNVPSMMGS